MKRALYLLLVISFLVPTNSLISQKKKKKADKTEKTEATKFYLDTVSLSGLKFRGIGPAFTSGRISDFAVHPENRSVYYVATASGGVWKTTNAGTTALYSTIKAPTLSVALRLIQTIQMLSGWEPVKITTNVLSVMATVSIKVKMGAIAGNIWV